MARKLPSKGKTRTRWRGLEGEAFIKLVDAIRYANCQPTKLRWEYVLRHLESLGYGVHTDPDKLKADYWSAVNNLLDQLERPLSHPDADALVDLVEDHYKLGAGGWEIDWPRALKAIHPEEHWITVRRLKVRYESAVKCCEAVFSTPAPPPAPRSWNGLQPSFHLRILPSAEAEQVLDRLIPNVIFLQKS